MGTVYLDVDDEITSAAARIRGSEATKVALVVPYGSRLSTSRMNFRLLSREALVNNRRLSIVAADPATRALAASAGLPVFASVAEYEAAGGGGPSAGDGAAEPEPAPAPEPAPRASGGLESSATVVVPPPDGGGQPAGRGPAPSGAREEAADARSRRGPKRRARSGPSLDETQPVAIPFEDGGPTAHAGTAAAATTTAGAAAGTAAAAAAGAGPVGRAPAPPTPAASPPAVPARVDRPARPFGGISVRGFSLRGVDITRGRTLPRAGGPTAIVAAAVILGLVVLGVGAYVFLPSAEIVVTPRSEPIGPISLVVRADPEATEVDAEAAVVPAQRIEVPVEVSETFTTAGRRIEERKATGSVTFTSENTFIEVTIPRGTRVATASGIAFVTTSQVVLPRASFASGPSRRDAPIEAVRPGPSGNVEAGTITERPTEFRLLLVSVTNAEPTSGGSREEFPRIAQSDIDAALEALGSQLEEAFAAAVGGGAGAPEGATPFPETAVLGEAAPTVDPATLLNREVESFELGLRATGTVIAVDDSPVERIAEQRLLQNVGADNRLVDGSVEIVPGDPAVENGEVRFPVSARAERVRILDPADLIARIKGRTVEEAEAILAEFGEVEITTWPEWVTTITGLDSRLSLVVAGQAEGDVPGGSGEPSDPPGGSTPEPDHSPAAPAAPSVGPTASPSSRPS